MEIEVNGDMNSFLSTVIAIVTLVANWQVYKKMGREGWEGIIPFYNTYVMFDALYGNGWKMLLLLIPLYNIYLVIKINIDLARGFNKSGAFGLGLFLLNTIFLCILAFSSNVVWKDGSAGYSADFVDRAKNFVDDGFRNNSDADKLRELKRLYDEGILTAEEFETKRKDIIDKM